ncbi:MAG TPA: hypothetical protein VL463_00650, partial [Kofleriaceae bacterium]|nr:hypothetical protein [Kofleriaceae bacterium]
MLFILAFGACGNIGGCGACSASAPLPTGGLPANQTIEGGAQVRVTPQGFTKLTQILPAVLNSSFASGFQIPQGSALGVDYCVGNCQVNVSLTALSTSVTSSQTLHIAFDAHASTAVRVSPPIFSDCTMTVDVADVAADMDLTLGVDPTTGELTIHLAQVNGLQLNGATYNGCSILSFVASLVTDILDSFVGQFVAQLLTPVIDQIVQGLLPHPLGLAGMLDVGKLLGGVSPGTVAEMEARLVPGGYVALNGNGLSLGMITGINSDIDPSTRSGTRPDGVPYVSEPALCVPPLSAPNFAGAPFNLPFSPRNTFAMNPADEFDGMPDPTTDIAMGISQTTLDLLGHHAVTSGGMCLGIGTSLIPQLNAGTISLFVPALADLDDSGKAPLLLVTRPQRELTFTIGDNTTTSPALTIGISHLEVDFYAFLYERYTRAFTLDLTLNAGVNLTFSQPPGMPAMITPTLVGISSSNVTVKVLNSDFVTDDPTHLEIVLPSVFDLVTPLLGNIQPIQVPNFAGFALGNLS